MTHTVDSRIKQYLYLVGQRWSSLEFEEQCHYRQGMRQGILQNNCIGVVQLTETAESSKPARSDRF
jgi:hypothetical protein